jgi:prepilin-type N-terminal cleavage/methylation domain-containing protein
MNKKAAFTLAEVLITLAIIGVVSAITIPNLITKYSRAATVHQLKENYATMQNVVRKSIDDNGDLDSWDYDLSKEEFAQTYFLPYFNGATKLKKNYTIYTIPSAGKKKSLSWLRAPVRYILNNGTVIGFVNTSLWNWPAAEITVDLNGYSKPNMLGRDVFVYAISRKTPRIFGFYDYCMDWTKCKEASRTVLTRPTVSGDAASTCNYPTNESLYAGESCGALIKFDGWKMAKDYPW